MKPYLLLGIAMEDTQELGGHIRLSGFRDVDGASMIIIKKIVGSFVKKISEKNKDFKSLTMTLKKVHGSEESETSGKYELQANLIADKPYNSDVTHQNLMFAVDTALKKVESGSK